MHPFSGVAADSATQTVTMRLLSRPQWAESWCQEMKRPSPGYRHQRVVSALHLAWGTTLVPDQVIGAPLDVVIDELNVLQPDACVFRHAPDRDVRWVPAPTIVVEVLSVSTG